MTRHWYIHSRVFSDIVLYMYTNNHCHTIWYEAIRKGTHITGFNEHTPQGTLREGKKH